MTRTEPGTYLQLGYARVRREHNLRVKSRHFALLEVEVAGAAESDSSRELTRIKDSNL